MLNFSDHFDTDAVIRTAKEHEIRLQNYRIKPVIPNKNSDFQKRAVFCNFGQYKEKFYV